MTEHDMAIALNFVVEGWLHSNGDNRENISRAIASLKQCANDWVEVLETKENNE